MHLNILPKLIFAVFSSKHIKWAIFDILMTLNLGVNITRQMTPIFLIYSLSSIRWYISFLHFKNLKFQSHGVPIFQYVLVCKIHISVLKMTLSSLDNTEILFLKRAFLTCFISSLVPIPWTNYSDQKRTSEAAWSIEISRVSRAVVSKMIIIYIIYKFMIIFCSDVYCTYAGCIYFRQ